ncbi:pyrroline-5-carboxylate reductase [Rhodovibrionaceae bacterium A322]
MSLSGSLLLIGCGKMGGALLAGWLKRGISAEQVHIVDPFLEPVKAGFPGEALNYYSALDDLPDDLAPSLVMLAVKPQMMDEVISPLARFASETTLFLSVAAGKTIGYFQEHLGAEALIVRSMPNTPSAVGRGMTVMVANDKVSAEQKNLCSELLSAVGETAWVDDEDLINPVTGLSGGGPAYVFLLIETMAKAGVEAGLPEELAMKLARSTVAGAGELVHQSSEEAATLRQNVTSPKGTTLEALNVLMADDGLQPLMTKAIAAASNRSRELAG